MLETIVVAFITALLTAVGTFMLQERRLRMELRTEFMAEQAARLLLESKKWKKRSFEAIKKRLDGFDDQELRRILIRSGAVRFEGSDGKELWGLISRNRKGLE